MTLIELDIGWFIDHQSNIESNLKGIYDTNKENVLWKCPQEMFAIESQFLMDSEFSAVQTRQHECAQHSKKLPKKRKRKLPLNDGEKKAIEFHEKVVKILQRAHDQLVTVAKRRGYIVNEEESVNFPQNNNTLARQFSTIPGPGEELILACNSQQHFVQENDAIDIYEEDDEISDVPINTLVQYNSESPCVKTLGRHKYLIPPHTQFLLSDISCLSPLIRDENKYNVIVLDPPWINKSIKRKKKYNTLQDADLYQIPMKDLCAEECLVLVWVTNKQSQHRFVTEELFKSWKIEYKTHWYWLKVTKYGEPVLPLSGAHKRPYECLIIGTTSNSKFLVPQNQVLISIPCATHSRKPPLNEIIQGIVNKNKSRIDELPSTKLQYLELFARNLTAGWTSWGNEVLKHQHVDFFVKK